MKSTFAFVFLLAFASLSLAIPSKLFGLWHCGSDGCLWAATPDLSSSQWILNRGDGQPTANVVVLSFADPQALLLRTTNQDTLNGIPRGMTADVVNFFKSKGIIVMVSIGGEEYSSDGKWTAALRDPTTLANNVVSMAKKLGVGIEIDYEIDSSSDLTALDTFARAYRGQIPFDNSSNASPEAILTVDVGAGTGYLTAVSKLASTWLADRVVNWENAMVTGGPYGSASTAEMYWSQHLDGVNWAQIPPVPSVELIGSLYSSDGSANCKSYQGTVLQQIVPFVRSKNMRGLFFWAVGCPAGPSSCVSDCAGLQAGSKAILG